MSIAVNVGVVCTTVCVVGVVEVIAADTGSTAMGSVVFVVGVVVVCGVPIIFRAGDAVFGNGAVGGVVGIVVKEFGTLLRRLSAWCKNPFARGRRAVDGKAMPAFGVSIVGGLVGRLLHSALEQLPVEVRDRWDEEWAEHSGHRRGWRLVWWAVCVRATAVRTGREYGRARLPLGR